MAHEEELFKKLKALYLEVDSSIVDDIWRSAKAALAQSKGFSEEDLEKSFLAGYSTKDSTNIKDKAAEYLQQLKK